MADAPRFLNAGNEGPFTLDGTRTYLVGASQVAVIDPGPNHPTHVDALIEELSDADAVAILLTHSHADHAGAAAPLARATHATVFGSVAGAEPLTEGALVPTDAGDLRVVRTPGHTRDDVTFLWEARRAAFVGDLMLGDGNTTWIGEYPGGVADYLGSLSRLAAIPLEVLYPAHGPAIEDPAVRIRLFQEHRLQRIGQVASTLESWPDASVGEIVTAVYGDDLPPALKAAAAKSVEAILDYLHR